MPTSPHSPRCAAGLLSTLVVALACTGTVTRPGEDPTFTGRHCPDDLQAPPLPTALRRLSHVEYRNVIHDAFPDVDLPPAVLAPDQTLNGFENAAALLHPSALLIGQYEDAAAEYAAMLAGSRDRWLACAPGTCGAALVETVGPRLFRRPLTEAQRSAYLGLFETQAAAIDEDAAVELTLYAMLQAPELLYRLELSSDGEPGEVTTVDGYEVASRMSFLLVGSIPDEALLTRVDELGDADVREEEARRLLATPAATEQLVDFHRQWLAFDAIDGQTKDPTLYPSWSDSLRDSIREESTRFVRHVMDGEGTLGALLTSNEGPVDANLASLYGVEPPASGWEVRALPEDERAGFLTRAGFLGATAHGETGSPPLRGVLILRRWLCEEIADPPMDADTSSPEVAEGEAPRTNRELYEQRTEPTRCQGCHHAMDGLGMGFEAYDAIGAHRTTDNGFAVDATGAIRLSGEPDVPFDGAVELSAELAASERVEACVTTQVFRFAAGRDVTSEDACRVESLTNALSESGGDLRELMVAIVRRPDFVQRTITE